jgi:MFS family permease
MLRTLDRAGIGPSGSDNAPPPVKAQRWYYGWNIVAACVLSQIVAMGMALNCFSLFTRGWSRDFHTPVSTLALSVTIFAFVIAAMNPIAGMLSDRMPMRRLFGLTLLLVVGFHVAIGLVTASWQIIVLYAVVAPITISITHVGAQALVSRWFVRRRGLAMGLTAFGIALAGVLFPPVIGWMMPHIGWRATWWAFAAIIGFAALPLVVGTIRDRPRPGVDSLDYLSGEEGAVEQPSLRSRDILRSRNFWVLVAVFIFILFVNNSVSFNLAQIVLRQGFDIGVAGWLISLFSIGALAGKLGSGILADRFGNKALLIAVALVSASGLLLLMTSSGLPMLALGLALIGMSGGVWTLLASAAAAEFGSRNFGRSYGLIMAFVPLGSAGAPVVAYLRERHGDYSQGLALLVAAALAGALAAALLRLKTRGRPKPASANSGGTESASQPSRAL